MMTVVFRCRLIDGVHELQRGELVDRGEWLRDDEYAIRTALESLHYIP